MAIGGLVMEGPKVSWWALRIHLLVNENLNCHPPSGVLCGGAGKSSSDRKRFKQSDDVPAAFGGSRG